jgi:TDG/mug DNA glycosylase family protein
MRISHPIEPVFDENSEILILGSFPSVKSREQMFFYGHPQNRFWKVMANVTGDTVPESIDEKKAFLLKNHIAVWDVIAQCDIEGSSDSSIKNVKANDLSRILAKANIKKICCNGAKSWELYNKYINPVIGIDAEKLPSTSPANAAWSVERLAAAWKAALV